MLPAGPELDRRGRRSEPFAVEIVVVDDGSTDATRALAERGLAGFVHQVLVHPRNRGKGAGLRTGMVAARGAFAAVTTY